MMSSKNPHRRYNPLIDEWILVSPHRTKRPWQGKEESSEIKISLKYDGKCYLCPGNTRVGGFVNPPYKNTFVFVNDFSALLSNSTNDEKSENSLFRIEDVRGECRVICFSPRHDLTLAQMDLESVRKVVDVWNEQFLELGEKYRWIQIFENRGEVMGSSNPHPHGQVWASNFLPNEPRKEDINQREYYIKNGSVLLCDYLQAELDIKKRIIVENEHWVVLVPFWAIWPYETMLLPKRHVERFTELTNNEKNSLASILKRHLTKYDNLFNTSFPYTMGWHGAPFEANNDKYWQLHAHFYPPLLRSATVKKFMVGYEMLAEAQRDITAEQAAEKLKSLSEKHYNNENKNDFL